MAARARRSARGSSWTRRRSRRSASCSSASHESVLGPRRRGCGQGGGKKSLFFCQSRSLTETVAERMRGRGRSTCSSTTAPCRSRSAGPPRSGSPTGRTPASSARRRSSWGSTSAISTSSSRRTRRRPCRRSCSGWGEPGAEPGTIANTTFLCEDPEAVLQAVALVELAREGWVERVAKQERCWPVLVHQLLAHDAPVRRRQRRAVLGAALARPRLPGDHARRVRRRDRAHEEGGVPLRGGRPAVDGAEGGEAVREEELPGALRRVLEPGALPRRHPREARHRVARAGLRRSPRRADEFVPPRRPRVDRRAREPRGSRGRRPRGAGGREAELGRVHPAAPRLRGVPADEARAHRDRALPVRRRRRVPSTSRRSATTSATCSAGPATPCRSTGAPRAGGRSPGGASTTR